MSNIAAKGIHLEHNVWLLQLRIYTNGLVRNPRKFFRESKTCAHLQASTKPIKGQPSSVIGGDKLALSGEIVVVRRCR